MKIKLVCLVLLLSSCATFHEKENIGLISVALGATAKPCQERPKSLVSYEPACYDDFLSRYLLEESVGSGGSDIGLVFKVSEKCSNENFIVKATPVWSKELSTTYKALSAEQKNSLDSDFKIKEKFIEYGQTTNEDEIFVAQKLSEMTREHECLNFAVVQEAFVCDFLVDNKNPPQTVRNPIPDLPSMHWYYLVMTIYKDWRKVLLNAEDLKVFQENKDLVAFSLRHTLYKAWQKYGFVHGDILDGTGNNMLYDVQTTDKKYIVFKDEGAYYRFTIKDHAIPILIFFDFSFSDMTQFKKFKKVPMESLDRYPIGSPKSTEYKRKTDIQGLNNVLASIFNTDQMIPQVPTNKSKELLNGFSKYEMTQSHFESWIKTVSANDIFWVGESPDVIAKSF